MVRPKSKSSKKLPMHKMWMNRLLPWSVCLGWIALLLLSLFCIVSLIDYSPADRGFTSTGSSQTIGNIAGVFGAWSADFFLTLFGRTGYILFVMLISISWRNIRMPKSDSQSTWYTGLVVLSFLVTIIASSALESLYFDSSYPFESGGILGQYFSHILVDDFSILAVTLGFLGLFVVGISIVMRIRWLLWMDRVGYAIFVFIAKLIAIYRFIAGYQVLSKFTKQKRTIPTKIKSDGIKNKTEIKPKKFKRASVNNKQDGVRDEIVEPNLLFEDVSNTFPSLSLLDDVGENVAGYSTEDLQFMSQLLVKKLQDFNVEVTVGAVRPGPVITRFEIEPAAGIKASQITGLSRDLARSLSVVSVRVVENIPGKTCIGIEIPNQNREIVRLVEGLSAPEYIDNDSPLSLVLGKDIAGNAVVADLIKMPHVLIAGTTGSGKSVCINALILSLIYKSSPEQVKMIMVDPKFLELSVYDGIPHLLAPVVTDMNKATNALRWCIFEMDRRFRLMAELAVRNIAGFNKKIQMMQQTGEPVFSPTEESTEGEQRQQLDTLPYIVVIVDELADLMMVAGKKIEEIIIRIAQRARAAGIHLVLATQRPSVDVVTGLIKANVPTRIAFQVSSRADSRTVIDQMGAEQLLGQGDMLFLPPGTGVLQRVHGSFVSDEEVAKVVADVKQSGKPVYQEEILSGVSNNDGAFSDGGDDGETDPLYDEAVNFVIQSRKASISALQRVLRVGYNRAARMIETMEQSGVVSSMDNGKREVLSPATED